MNSQPLDIVLYGTLGCHLCDEAQDVLDLVLSSTLVNINYSQIDISEDDILLERYERLIPVLRATQTEQELNWPFEANQVLKFLRNNSIL